MSITLYKGGDIFNDDSQLERLLEIEETRYQQVFCNPLVIEKFPYMYEEYYVQLFEDGDNNSFSSVELPLFEIQLTKIKQDIFLNSPQETSLLDQIIACIHTTYHEKLTLYLCHFKS